MSSMGNENLVHVNRVSSYAGFQITRLYCKKFFELISDNFPFGQIVDLTEFFLVFL